MNLLRAVAIALSLSIPAAAQATADDLRSVAGMESHNRALVVFAPSLSDTRMQQQHAVMAQLAVQAASLDLLLVQVDTRRVIGSHDSATALRRRFRVPPETFRALLIDKDGKVVLTAPAPIRAGTILRAFGARR